MSDDHSNPVEVVEIPSMPELCLLRLRGELTRATASALDASVNDLPAGTKKHAIADMSGVTLVTSTGLGKLLGVKQRFMEKGGDLVLAAMSLDLKTKFLLMGANKIFKIYFDIPGACNAYAWEVKHETERLNLSFPPHLRMVPPVRHFVSRVMRCKGYGDRDRFRIETIVDEICNNAIQYGSSKGGNNITLTLKIHWDRVELDAENVSDPEQAEALKKHMKRLRERTCVDADDKRGRGLALVKMLASELTADISRTGTTVHVTKLKKE